VEHNPVVSLNLLALDKDIVRSASSNYHKSPRSKSHHSHFSTEHVPGINAPDHPPHTHIHIRSSTPALSHMQLGIPPPSNQLLFEFLNSSHKNKPKDPKDEQSTELTDDDQFLLLTSIVRGFSLDSKNWGEFFVDNVKDIEWATQAFSSLILPGNLKEVIRLLVQSQLKNEHKFDDVVKGKGQGIVILLAGPPGVGKTLTAESTAEHLRVPLYCLTASELGETSETIDMTLRKVFPLVKRWKAVLLLDEADVYLEKRTADGLLRNRLVATFLRTLEYYRGILFLTTNRLNTLDPAFESRIHLALKYTDLDINARKSVWSNFMNQTINFRDISEEDMTRIAEIPLNGRQIKNKFKIAQLLADGEDKEIGIEHVKGALGTIDGASNIFAK